MHNQKSKLLRIMTELMRFYFSLGLEHINIEFNPTGKIASIKLIGKCTDRPDGTCSTLPFDDIENINIKLNAPRQKELEDYYWSLVGGPHKYEQLDLLGSLVDEGNIQLIDDQLVLEVFLRV